MALRTRGLDMDIKNRTINKKSVRWERNINKSALLHSDLLLPEYG